MNYREVILKKKKNAILKGQIEQYEKVLDEVSNDKNGNVPNESLLQDAEKSGFERHNANFSPDPLLNASHGDSQQKYKSIYNRILF